MFEWDQQKNKTNQLKHGVRFEDAAKVFSDDHAAVFEDNRHDEQRWKIIGTGSYLMVLVVVYAHLNKIRIISARKATKRERKEYEQGKK